MSSSSAYLVLGATKTLQAWHLLQDRSKVGRPPILLTCEV